MIPVRNRSSFGIGRPALRLAGLLVALLLLASSGWAQSGEVIELEELLKKSLKPGQQDLLEEYLDILEDLQDILTDYSDYMDDESGSSADHWVESLSTLQDNLEEGDYKSSPQRLLQDIDQVVDDIKEVERDHRIKFDTNDPRCCRLPRSLRKELLVIAELVEDQLDRQAGPFISESDLERYVEAVEEYMAALEEHEVRIELSERERQSLEQALERLGIAESVVYALGDVEIETPVIVLPKDIDVTEIEIITRPDIKRGKSSKVGARHQSSGTVSVSSSSLPIVLENPTGDIIVTGTSGDIIKAHLDLEVSASSHAKEKQYIGQVQLEVGADHQNYYVVVDMPRLSDHKTSLLGCVLTVEVPSDNELECSNSFGQVFVTGISSDVRIDGENSTVSVTDVDGAVDIENSTGSIELGNIEGRISLENSYGPMTLEDCRGTMTLENQYSPVRLRRCEGRLEIVNTGRIELIDHEGDVFIENAYGEIEIDDVDGSVIVGNGYQPIFVSGVTGSAELENEYGEISAERISGSLYARTSNGAIFLESIDGPLEITNDNGNVSLTLGAGFRGGSSISASGGTIKLTVLEEPNVTLDIFTEGGSVSSRLPIDVERIGNTKSAELVFGDGSKVLELIGFNTSIVIQNR